MSSRTARSTSNKDTKQQQQQQQVNDDDASKKKGGLRKELEMMHREMEVATYPKNRQGQAVRVTPKEQSLERTLKRKSLENDDAKERAIEVTAEERKILEKTRVRGAKAALTLGDEVNVHPRFMRDKQPHDPNNSDDSNSENSSDGESAEEDAESNDEDDEEETEVDDDLNVVNGDTEEKTFSQREKSSKFALPQEDTEEGEQPSKSRKQKNKKNRLSGVKMARSMYRLKNFSSQKLAEKHGDALGAHAMGKQRQAVSKLAEVAEAAPIAPQLYSSLGLVYENMLEESEKELLARKKLESNNSEGGGVVSAAELLPIIRLGEKAYGSYHVAAVLCKKDFSLWVRAGDSACEIADLYDSAMRDLKLSNLEEVFFRSEKLKWLTEAKEDYEVADKLKPPGITVPAKLASIHVNLGNLAEALTILTDMRNSSCRLSLAAHKRCSVEGGVRARTDLEQSFTAWLLYADLMLRIGHECIQWNSGVSTNENYYFKRWLRKHSCTFDWKERRLQALCFALEAAAGSKSCQSLVAWLKGHIKRRQDNIDDARWKIDDYEDNDKGENMEGEANDAMKMDMIIESGLVENGMVRERPMNGNDAEGTSETDSVFIEERNSLLKKNRDELDTFDFDTENLNLDTNDVVARKQERDVLLKSHRSAIVSFIGEHQAQKCNDTSIPEAPLSIAASCGAICSIASQLIKHCLDLALYKSGRLTAEAISFYFKQRYSRSQHRKRNLERCWSRIKANETDILQISKDEHDEMQSETEREDSFDEDMILSDDEEIDNRDDEALIHSLKNGALPPDIRFLYALALLGEGMSDFAALKMLASVNDLDSEPAKLAVDTDLIPDKNWITFRSAATEKLQRPAALMMLSDLLRSTSQEETWAEKVLPLFENLPLEEVSSLLVYSEDDNDRGCRNSSVKFFVVISRLRLYAAISASDSRPMSASIEIALSIISNIEIAHQDLWRGARSSTTDRNDQSVMLIELLSKAFCFISRLLLKNNECNLSKDLMEKLTKSMNTIIGIIFSLHLPKSASTVLDEEQIILESCSALPCLSNWQDEIRAKISERCFLLCVGMNVVLFSGWGDEEFNLETLYGKRGSGFFGVKVFGSQMTGHLHLHSERFLSTLWRRIPDITPNFPQINFDDHLDRFKESSWHKETIKKFKDLSSAGRISTSGEDFGLDLMLSLSAINLFNASKETALSKKDDSLKTAMSVILPVTQFCLDINVWDSSIGRGVSDETAKAWNYYLKERATDNDNTESRKFAATTVRTKPIFTSVTTAALKSSSVNNRVGSSVQKTWKPNSCKFVRVPSSLLLREWKQTKLEEINASVSLLPSRVSMKKVDFAMKHLRSCFTVQALQKASIRVAAALLEVATDPLCNNPFICLSHASIFAGHGPKGGNSDEPFKQRLPSIDAECTPVQALLILGRADCLRAVAFTDEAIFLCSYVAKVVAKHRDQKLYDYEWTPQWRVVGIQAYLLSASIDTSIKSFLSEEPTTTVWEANVNYELKLSKNDAEGFERASLCVVTPKHFDLAAGRTHIPVEEEYHEVSLPEFKIIDCGDYDMHEQNAGFDAFMQGSDDESHIAMEEV